MLTTIFSSQVRSIIKIEEEKVTTLSDFQAKVFDFQKITLNEKKRDFVSK